MNGVSAELREFVTAKFGSSEQVDTFVLLYRHRDREWSPAEVARELATAPQSAGMRLYLLSSGGLLKANGEADVRYHYEADPLIDSFAALLIAQYEADKTQIYALVSGASPTDPVKQLADAFRLRK
jgi:hypothetical protein